MIVSRSERTIWMTYGRKAEPSRKVAVRRHMSVVGLTQVLVELACAGRDYSRLDVWGSQVVPWSAAKDVYVPIDTFPEPTRAATAQRARSSRSGPFGSLSSISAADSHTQSLSKRLPRSACRGTK